MILFRLKTNYHQAVAPRSGPPPLPYSVKKKKEKKEPYIHTISQWVLHPCVCRTTRSVEELESHFSIAKPVSCNVLLISDSYLRALSWAVGKYWRHVDAIFTNKSNNSFVNVVIYCKVGPLDWLAESLVTPVCFRCLGVFRCSPVHLHVVLPLGIEPPGVAGWAMVGEWAMASSYIASYIYQRLDLCVLRLCTCCDILRPVVDKCHWAS